jgi:uncharacterized C2H2 Zn-finger protein
MLQSKAWTIATDTTPIYECPLCNETFEDETDLYNHLVDNHTEKEGKDLI